MLHVSSIIRNSRALKESVTQTRTGCNSGQKRCARDKLFESLLYDFLESRYSTKSERGLARNRVQVEIARRKVLKLNKWNGVLGHSLWILQGLVFDTFSQFVHNLGSGSGHEQVASMEVVVNGTVEGGKIMVKSSTYVFWKQHICGYVQCCSRLRNAWR